LKGINDDTVPDHNSAIHKLGKDFVDDDEAFTRTFVNVVISKSAEEKNSEAAGRKIRNQRNLEKAELKRLVSHIKQGGNLETRVANIEAALIILLERGTV
jgi:endonuclease III